ncbi:MAG: twin transmembrane helix small protein [Rhizobiales bacterium]|nr:twin transmembrane helix small protein [Hyphomicrobiales bacterium]
MEKIAFMMAPLAVVLVFIVLCIGLWNMMRGTNPNLSQRLMRWRVGLQFVAVCLLMTVILFDA